MSARKARTDSSAAIHSPHRTHRPPLLHPLLHATPRGLRAQVSLSSTFGAPRPRIPRVSSRDATPPTPHLFNTNSSDGPFDQTSCAPDHAPPPMPPARYGARLLATTAHHSDLRPEQHANKAPATMARRSQKSRCTRHDQCRRLQRRLPLSHCR